MNVDVKFKMKPIDKILIKRGIQENGKIQKAFTNEVYKHSNKYTPMRTGTLRKLVVINDSSIHYKAPYARVNWYGKVMVGRPPKRPSEKDIKFYWSPTRGPFWVKRMWSDKGSIITRKIANMAGGRSK